MNNQFLSSINAVVEHFKRLQEELELVKKDNLRLKNENNELKKLNKLLERQTSENKIDIGGSIPSSKTRLDILPLKEQIYPDISTKKRKIDSIGHELSFNENIQPSQEVDNFIYSSPVDLIASPTQIKSLPIEKENTIEINKIELNYNSSPSKIHNASEPKSYKNVINSQLPTQYSYDSSSPIKSPSKNQSITSNSSIKSTDEFTNDNRVEIIEDSDDELDKALIKSKFPLSNIDNGVDIPNSFTKLQRREYICNHLKKEFDRNPRFVINLDQNPINESSWVLTDFTPNENYIKPKVTKKLGYSRQQQREIDAFYKAANEYLLPSSQEAPIHSSQFYDKFPSPPGFMVSDFPSTQEEESRRNIIKRRQEDRLHRRVRSCLVVKNRMQTGEFVFFHEILNKFVLSGRYTITSTP